MRNNDTNNKPLAIFVCSALFIFAGIGAIILNFVKNFEGLASVVIFAFCAVFEIVGIIMLVYGIIRTKAIKAMNKVLNDESAYTTTAKFIGSKISGYSKTDVKVANVEIPTSINVFHKIIYSYVDENGVERTVRSVLTYFPQQAKYLKEKGEFAIKCKGKVSAIIEELPEVSGRYNIK